MIFYDFNIGNLLANLCVPHKAIVFMEIMDRANMCSEILIELSDNLQFNSVYNYFQQNSSC